MILLVFNIILIVSHKKKLQQKGMQNKSIITKTINKIKPINNQDKIVSFNDQTNSLKTAGQNILKAHALLSSKALPTISRLLTEDDEDDLKSTDRAQIEGQLNLKRRSRNKSSKTIKLTLSEKTFSKIALANDNEFLVSDSTDLFHPKEKIYIGPSYSSKADEAKSISDFSYSDNNKLLESTHIKAIAIDNFEGNSEGLFCLFEGHDGPEVANYLQKNMRSAFSQAKKITSDIDNAIKIAFYNIDKTMKEFNIKNGSTGNIVYIRKENSKPVIYAANVGNTKTLLISFDSMKELSYEHKVNNAMENKRLVSSGAMIVNEKLMGHFKLSRSFGDFDLKAFGVKCEPYIERHVIEDNDQFILLLSSSLMSIIGESNIRRIAERQQTSSLILREILHSPSVTTAKELMSCYVLRLQKID